MNFTTEQQAVIDYVKQDDKEPLVLIDSVAGSGKTTVLKGIADAVGGKNSLYLAYNKAIATESKGKFPKNVNCRTTHSLAYGATVRPMGLSVGFFGPRDVKEKMPYKQKHLLAEDIRRFCLSSHLSYDEFAEEIGAENADLANKYLNLMSTGAIDCTHDFYLKMFHMLLASDDIECPTYDIVMLDEAGDLNEVTLEIFMLLPAKLKVAVGDPHQNIYTFNHTINCFEKLEGMGKTFKLPKSFRVPKSIAAPVEQFCKTYLNPDMMFEGIEDNPDAAIKTRGYISRTNSALVNKIIELNAEQTPYGLVRKAQEIFKLPLMVAGLKYQGKIYDPAYTHVQKDVDDWTENVDNIKRTQPTLYGYLRSIYEDDIALINAINIVAQHGKNAIFEAYAEAKNHESKKQDLLLLTAHSSKGLEFDQVILAPDMNASIDAAKAQVLEDPETVLSAQDRESLNLYYVACTRALVRLTNANHLRKA
ncbi:putative UvrD-type helicase [Alteromonas phage vB_AmaP_AD45-P3]|nr:putative UvrD-type helicase [Alteromonas phage vB_AmaP_AD45-P3]